MSLPPPGSPPPGSQGPGGPGGGFAPPTQPPGYQPGAGPPIGPPTVPFQTAIPPAGGDGKPPWYRRPVTWAWALVVLVVGGGGIAFAVTRGGDDDDSSAPGGRNRTTVPDDETIPGERTLPPDRTLPGGLTLPTINLPPGVTLPGDGTLPGVPTIPDTPPGAPPGDTDGPDDTTVTGITVAPVGDLVPLGTPAEIGSGFTVTVNAFTEDDTAAITAANPPFQPIDGFVYSVVNVTVAFDGDPTLGSVALLDFNGIKEPNIQANWYSTLFIEIDDQLPFAAQLAPGASVTGNIVLEVPAFATSDLTLRVESFLAFDREPVDFALR